MTVRRTVELDDQLYERVRTLAKQEHRSVNAQIQVLLQQALNQREQS